MSFFKALRVFAWSSSALFLLCALVSYHPQDQTLMYAALEQGPIMNICGSWGACISAWLLLLCGFSAYLLIFVCLCCALYHAGYDRFVTKEHIIALICMMPVCAMGFFMMQLEWYPHIQPGGIIGERLVSMVRQYTDHTMIAVGLFFALWAATVLFIGFAWVAPVVLVLQRCIRLCKIDRVILEIAHVCEQVYVTCVHAFYACVAHVRSLLWPVVMQPQNELEKIVYDKKFWEHVAAEPILPVEPLHCAQQTAAVVDNANSDDIESFEHEPVVETVTIPYRKPDVATLAVKRNEASKFDKQEQQAQAQVLEEKLKRFGIRGSVLAITAGPVVTLYEYQPHIDVPISKIIAREDDLALALQALSLRIIAPIPGKSVIGFEVSNAKRKMVLFAESANAPSFMESDASLPLIIGQNTIGEQVVIDLTKMPHLLVAGSTGSGKSVALNAMLVSLLCKATPDDVRMILIDPKRLEFSSYTDIPHLLFPIVIDPHTAMQVLQWAIVTMEARYEQIAAAGVRNISDYNQTAHKPMPYMVIVIDELADLMMVAGKEIEGSIARLAQMARAAGIHLILATQRPSVDVITGVVKVNFPARLACKVTSKVDSRTILDVGGAEKLLGKGDMLFLDPQGKLLRFHGAFVTDQEINHIVTHVKAQRAVLYETLPTVDKDCTMHGEDAALYKELLAFVKTIDEVSISLLQRRFRIGYNRSARFIDILEAQGIIMPSAGGKTRKVLH